MNPLGKIEIVIKKEDSAVQAKSSFPIISQENDCYILNGLPDQENFALMQSSFRL